MGLGEVVNFKPTTSILDHAYGTWRLYGAYLNGTACLAIRVRG